MILYMEYKKSSYRFRVICKVDHFILTANCPIQLMKMAPL